jgi:hypothetical protein
MPASADFRPCQSLRMLLHWSFMFAWAVSSVSLSCQLHKVETTRLRTEHGGVFYLRRSCAPSADAHHSPLEV